MVGHEIRTCSSCGAAIVWAKTAAGKNMPLDAEPTTDGTIELRGNQAYNVGATKRPDQLLYKSHFATCKFAGEHRKPKESKP